MKPKSVLVMLDPLSLPRLDGICSYAREHGWRVILEDRLLESVDLRHLDGVLTSLRGRQDQLAKVRQFRKLGIPVVDLTVACPNIRLPRVVSDHQAIGALAAHHFLERGFDSFAWYSSGWSPVHALRYKGFSKALKGHSVPRLATLHASLADLRHPLAVLAFDEPDAARVIRECRDLQLDVPATVAVLGIGNDRFLCENFDITISSVDQNLALAARRGCELLGKLMSRRSATSQSINRTILVPPAGVIPRASTDTLAHPDPTVRAALVYIHRHLNKPFGAAETAEAVGLPRSTLDHLFAEKVGHSIGQEILNQRIRRAKHLLKDNHTQLKAIAGICGFCNASYFTNTFKRETGLSPKDWRHQMTANATCHH